MATHRVAIRVLVALAVVLAFVSLPSPVAAQTVNYDAGNNIITVTGGTEGSPATFEDVYQADVAGGWGVVSKQGDRQYEIRARLYIGDGSTTTWFATEREQITFYSTGSSHYMLQVMANATFRSGVLVDYDKGQGSDGSSITLVIDNAGHTSMWFFMAAGTAYLYDSRFLVDNKAGVTSGNLPYFHIQGVDSAFQCQFTNWRRMFRNYGGKFYNCVATGGHDGWGDVYFSTDSGYIWAFNTASVDWGEPPRTELGRPPVRLVSFETLAGRYNAEATYVGGIRDFLGEYPYPVPSWGGTPVTGASIEWYATVEVTVHEADNTPIASATVRVYNSAGTLQFEEVTDANGYATGVVYVVRDQWTGAANTRTDYNDFTLGVVSAGYADYETEFTVYNPVDWLIVLDGLTYTYDDIMAGQTGLLAWLEDNFGGDIMYLILLGGLAVALLIAFVWKKHAFLSYGSAGAWALLGFTAFTMSESGNPANITDTHMGLFWVSLAFTIVCALIPTLMREKPAPDDYPLDALGDDMSAFLPKPSTPLRPRPRPVPGAQFARTGTVPKRRK